MIKYFVIHSRQKVYGGTIVSMPPVMCVEKLYPIYQECLNIIGKNFSQIKYCKNIEMSEKSQVSAILNSDNIFV